MVGAIRRGIRILDWGFDEPITSVNIFPFSSLHGYSFTMQLRAVGHAVSALFCLAVSGCIIPLADSQVPVRSTTNRVVDPRPLCGDDGPIHVGATRDAVHSAVGVGDYYFGSIADAHKPDESYFFKLRAGSFLWLSPNPEGGFLGINKRYIDYDLTVEYGPDERVRMFRMTTMEALDPHESAN